MVHLCSYEGSENSKLRKVSHKGNYEEKCLGWHELTTFSENLMLFGHFEVSFWSYEGSENGKLQKDSPYLKAIAKGSAQVAQKSPFPFVL